MLRTHLIALLSVSLIGCPGERPEESLALGETPTGTGPMVIFDVLDKPLPLVPLPNDVATRLDDSSASGRFINISKIAPTFLEMDTRAKADRLDGFGAFMPITVAFDKPLDVQNIIARHQANDDSADDAVYLVNIDPSSSEFGKRMPLDIGSGNYPITLEKRDNYFENDEHKVSSNILLETFDEDLNDNGVLDPGEDRDWDGQLDRPNFIDPDAEPASFLPEGYALGEVLCAEDGLTTDDFADYENLLDFFERETNTLLMRPVMPLRQLTRYAVVLTDRLVGEDGQPVRSPWPGKHHASQADALEVLPSVLGGLGLTTGDVAFAWTYTTGSTTRELEWIRAGLYGHGKMDWLADEYPDDQFLLDPTTSLENSLYYAPAAEFQKILPLVADELIGGDEDAQAAVLSDIGTLGGIVMGEFISPNFLVDRDGIATADYPADDDEVIEIDARTGQAPNAPAKVTWWCALPKRTEAHGDKPFKVVIYGHGYTSQRLEMLAFAGRATRFGMAVCALDAFGHGLVLPDDEIQFGDQTLNYTELLQQLLPQISNIGPFADSLLKGRARDLDNDGEVDSGGDFWTADLFHTRDVVRQTIVDHMRFIQLLRTFDGDRRWVYDTNGDGTGDLAGDFDGDGIVDIGGRADNYHMWGQSLGGIVAGVLAGIEPSLVAAAPVAGGAGLTDIGVRSRQSGVPEAVFLPLMGPFVVGNPSADGGVELKFLVNNINQQSHHVFGVLESATPGDRIELLNTNNGERVHAVVPTDRKFRLPFPADALTSTERRPILQLDDPSVVAPVAIAFPEAIGDHIEIRLFKGGTDDEVEFLNTFEIDVLFQGTLYAAGKPLVAISKGLGLRRNSPELRRMLSVAQMIIEGGDPASFAPYYDKPLDFSYDPDATPGANVLVIPTAGDMNVPVNTGVAIARAAGFIELEAADPSMDGSVYAGKSQNRVLIDTYTLESIECLPRWRSPTGEPVLFDIDDLDFGVNQFGEVGLPEATDGKVPPLRITMAATHSAGGVHGMRIPMVRRTGNHGFGPPSPGNTYDIDNYMNNLVYHYFYNDGRIIADHPCLADSSCGQDGEVTLPFDQADWEKKGSE